MIYTYSFVHSEDNLGAPDYGVCRGLDVKCFHNWKRPKVSEYRVLLFPRTGSPRHQNLGPALTPGPNPALTDANVVHKGMLASSRACGEILAKYGKSATYIDAFMHRHPYAPGLILPDQDVATVGAYHTADVPYWFDTLDTYNLFRTTRAPTAWDRQLTDQMLGAVIAMAETGSPSTKAMPWPAWTASNPQYLVLGDAVTTKKLDLKRMDWLAAHPVVQTARPAQRAGPRD